jgi:sporulation protein YlmC with PRC-barrel domain
MSRSPGAALAVALSLFVGAPAIAQQPAATADSTKVVVAAIRLENGYRASKVIGASVYNAQNEQIGTVSDLFLSKQNQVTTAVISVGGFVGIGSKLVAIPFDQLQIDEHDKVVMANGTKDTLKGMPDAKYAD